MTLQRREFLAAAAMMPLALSLPKSLELQRKEIFDGVPIGPLKVFLVSDWSDSHYIIARSGQLAAHYWYTELGGEPVPRMLKSRKLILKKTFVAESKMLTI